MPRKLFIIFSTPVEVEVCQVMYPNKAWAVRTVDGKVALHFTTSKKKAMEWVRSSNHPRSEEA